jgi:protein-S-isoprenylcysteine O-methyltransferase Ste14
MPSNFYRQAAWFSTFLERYVLSVFYIAYAWAYFLSVRDIWPYLAQGHSADFADFARAVSMLLLLLFEGLTLLVGRQAVTTPENLEELLVPIATSFYYLVYAAVPWLPGWMQESLAPDRWQWPIQVTGVTVDTLGAVISMWGVLYLGRSFGIFVAVRKVVLRGPYRYVRHPIYCGYLFMFAGVALTYFCPAMLVLVPIHYWLFFYRARLEETRLAKFSPEYRAYMKGTGFMLPRLRKANG